VDVLPVDPCPTMRTEVYSNPGTRANYLRADEARLQREPEPADQPILASAQESRWMRSPTRLETSTSHWHDVRLPATTHRGGAWHVRGGGAPLLLGGGRRVRPAVNLTLGPHGLGQLSPEYA
jgi:hypothetical protein